MSLFKKPKRSFRSRRKNTSESEDEKANEDKMETEENDNSQDSTVSQKSASPAPVPSMSSAPGTDGLNPGKKLKKKKKDGMEKVPSAASVLSFDEELEEGEEFKIKRSSHSRRVAKQLKKESRKEMEDRERREREEANVAQVSQMTQIKKEKEAVPESVNGSRPSLPTEKRTPKMEPMQLDNGEGPGSEGSGSSGEDDSSSHAFNKPSFSQLLQSGHIPDATLIHMARKRRQQQRERGGEDFIPIDDPVTEKKGSRLIRDDDNDHSEDDEDERISFSTDKREQQLRKIQTSMLAAAEDSEGSEHGDDWELQQIRKGVGIPAQQTNNTMDTAAAAAMVTVPADHLGYQQGMFGQHQPVYPPHPGFHAMPPSSHPQQQAMPAMPTKDMPVVNLDQIKKRMQDRLSDMCSVHRAHDHEHSDLESRIEACTEAIARLESSTDRMEEQSRFFQEMRGYVRDLIECLSEKMPTLQSLETLMLNLLSHRADRLLKRRQEDIKDLSQEFSSSKALAAPGLVDVSVQDPARQRRNAEREGRR